jgi:uncharacterized protein (TIGR02145 family)
MKLKISFLFVILLTVLFFSCTKTATTMPTCVTLNVAYINSTTAQCGGAVSGKKITEKGVCWNTSGYPTISDNKTSDGAGDASYISNIDGLIPLTTYYLRAYATNEIGTVYGDTRQFTTTEALTIPEITTGYVTGIGQTSASCTATISANGNVAITSQGFCWSKNHNPTIADSKYVAYSGSYSFNGSITGLTGSTMYYVRAFATNSIGTAYGDEVSFSTPGTMTDVDGNVYKTVSIAGKEWMGENLKVIHYRDGTTIPMISSTSNGLWTSTTAGAYCNYADNPSNGIVYGMLYNWYAVADNKNIAPAGWHIPTAAEWDAMINSLGGYGSSGAGPKLKESGSAHWYYSYSATNESNFSAYGAGYRDLTGYTNSFQQFTGFWTKSGDGNSSAFYIMLDNYNNLNKLSDSKNYGFSIRCVKD